MTRPAELYRNYPESGRCAHITPHNGEWLVQVYPTNRRERMVQVSVPTLQAARYAARSIATR
jgi:hypothetical protein